MTNISINGMQEGKEAKANDTDAGFSQTRPAVCKILEYKGRPTVFINGNPFFPLSYLTQFPKQERFINMRSIGTRFFGPFISLGDRFAGMYKNQQVRSNRYHIWYAPGKIDFELFDETMNELLDVVPDAYIFPRIACNCPSWWDNYNPAEVNRSYQDGYPMAQSFSSKKWRDETADVLRKIVQHIYKSNYADRFVGGQICFGDTNESVHQQWLGHSDYSLAAQNSFKEWLLKTYNYDKELVKRTFPKEIDDIKLPTPAEREHVDFGRFIDPVKSGLVLEFRRFRANEIIESLEALCGAFKEESSGNLLVGTLYGHTLVQWLDHMDFHRILKSKNIDLFSSTTWGTEIASIKKAGKIFYNEGDEKTSVGKWISETRPEVDPYHTYDLPAWIRSGGLQNTLEHLKSEFSTALYTGSTLYWYDLWGGWYDNERISKLFKEVQLVANDSVHLSCDSVAEICVIVDERSFHCISYLRRPSTNGIPWISAQKSQLDRIGAPFDMFLSQDLADLDCARYKLIIFLNSYLLTEQDKDIIKKKCKDGERVLLWLYAPGIISDTLSIDHISEFTKMAIGYEEDLSSVNVNVNVDLPDQSMEYVSSAVSPFLFVKDTSFKVYAKTKDGRAVLVEKSEEGYTNVLATAPPLPWQVLNFFAKKAGVHIYCDSGDVLFINKSYLSVKCVQPGNKVIKLSEHFDFVELLDSSNDFEPTKRSVSNKTGEIDMSFSKSGECKLFQIIS